MKKVSVTQLVDFAKCEKLGVLKLTRQEQLTQERQTAVNAGVRAHHRLETQGTVDGRCFVASFALGADAPETAKLRAFRDAHLLSRALGRLLVSLYYFLSPACVGALRRLPGGQAWAASIVRWLADRLPEDGA